MRMSAPSNQIEPTRWFRVVLKERVAVRYAWADNPTCTLFNQAGGTHVAALFTASVLIAAAVALVAVITGGHRSEKESA